MLKAQDGEIRVPAKTLLAGQIDGPYDVILLCCKAYDLDDALAAIAPAVGPGSAVLPFLNGIRHLAILSDRFGPERVLGGVTAVNAVLASNGDVVQSPVKIDMTALGEPSGQRSARCAEIQQAFAAGGIAATVSDDITAFMWAKLFAFACIATVATLTRARPAWSPHRRPVRRSCRPSSRNAAGSSPLKATRRRRTLPISSAVSTHSASRSTVPRCWWTWRKAGPPRAGTRSGTWSSAPLGAESPRPS